jgi:DNA polymerase III subunit beta
VAEGTFHREGLLHALGLAVATIPSRATADVLRMVRLDLTESAANIYASSGSEWVRYTLSGATVARPGSLLLPAAELVAIIRELDDLSIVIDEQLDGTAIVSPSGEFTLATPAMRPDAFPVVEEVSAGTVSIRARALHDGLNRVLFVVSEENSRYAYGSVAFEISGQTLSLVGCDQTSMATVDLAIDGSEGAADGTYLLSPKFVRLVLRLLADEDDDSIIWLSLSDARAGVQISKAHVTGQNVDGRYPRWRDIVPRDGQIIPLAARLFEKVLRQSRVFLDKETRGVRFEFASGGLTLSVAGSTVGSSRVSMPVAYDREPASMTLNAAKILPWVKAVSSADEISMLVPESPPTRSRSTKPVLFSSGQSRFVLSTMIPSLSEGVT